MKKESTFAQIASGGFIDIDLHENAKNVLIIGNTYGFFGYYKDGNRGVDLDEDKTGEMEKMSERLIWMSNRLSEGTKFTIFGNAETLKYYQMVFSFFKESIKFNWNGQIKVKQIEKDSEYLEYMNMAKDNNMKFDFVIQNPPYSGSLHLDFLEKGLEILDNGNGKMTIIEPATWLINVRGLSKKEAEIKEKIKGHVYKVVIENFNKEFGVCLYVPCSITYIDMDKTFDSIEFICCGDKKYVNDLHECNLIGDYINIHNILNKVIKYDVLKNHITKNKQSGKYYAAFKHLIGHGGIADNAERFNWDSQYFGKYNLFQFHAYLPSFSIKEEISSELIPIIKAWPSNKEKPIYKENTIGDNICGSKSELLNFKYNLLNTKLLPFINIALTIHQQNVSLKYVPWLVDKQYTDEEINQLFGFSEEEIALIDRTIKKYERYSPWFKRYMCGPSSVSDEEVQKFIDNL